MGIQGAFAFLEKKGFKPEVADLACQREVVHVDVLSLFYGYVVATMTSMMHGLLKKEYQVDSDNAFETRLRHSLVPRMTSLLDIKLRKTFNPRRAILHFDGRPSREKQQAHDQRLQVFQNSVQHVQNQVGVAHNVLDQVRVSALNQPARRSAICRLLRAHKSAVGCWKAV